MKKIEISGLEIFLNDNFKPMNDNEKKMFLGNVDNEHSYIDSKQALICISNEIIDCSSDLIDEILCSYEKHYRDFAPGYEKGEAIVNSKRGSGILTFKTNTPKRQIFNFIYIKRQYGCSIQAYCSCSLSDAFEYLPMFSKIFGDL